MDFQRSLQRILRIICAYAAVCMILLICLCVGLWSSFETSLRATNEAFQNIFQRRRNVRFIDSDEETSKDELQTFPKATNPTSDNTSSECVSSPTFSGPTETLNTAEKATEKQTKNDQISTKNNFSNLEGLALQMVHLEQHRMSTDVPHRPSSSEISHRPSSSEISHRPSSSEISHRPSSSEISHRPSSSEISHRPSSSEISHRPSSSEICVRSPNESSPVKATAPKSVLKSSCSETKSPTRGTRRIRFQDPPVSEVSAGSSAAFISPKKSLKGGPVGPKQRKVLSPAAYLKSGLNFQESPAKASGTRTRITEQSSEAVKTENAPMIDSSSEISCNQQLANEETKSLAEESNSTIPTAFSSEIADSEQKADKSIDPLSEELNSTILTELSSETSDSQQQAKESVDSLSDGLNPTTSSMLSTKTTTNQQVSKESMDSFSEESNSTSTSLSTETATNDQKTKESMDSVSEELNSSVPVAYKEFEESPKAGDRFFEPERVESTSKCKSDEISLMGQISEELSNQIKEMKIGELRYESSAKEERTASSDEKEESFKKGGTEDISELSEMSENINEGENLQEMNLLSESICQQSTKQLINANLGESTLSDELCPTSLKTDEELCKSAESEGLQASQEEEACEETSQEVIAQTSNKIDVEKLSEDSSEREGMGHLPVKKRHSKKVKKTYARH